MTDLGFLQVLANMVGVVGVPAALAFILLWKFNGKLERMVETMAKLQATVAAEHEQDEALRVSIEGLRRDLLLVIAKRDF
jgi:hypothetical protein